MKTYSNWNFPTSRNDIHRLCTPNGEVLLRFTTATQNLGWHHGKPSQPAELKGTFSAGAIIPAFLEPQPSIYAYGLHQKTGQGITNAIGLRLDIEKSIPTAQL
jgi:hypothetical protein